MRLGHIGIGNQEAEMIRSCAQAILLGLAVCSTPVFPQTQDQLSIRYLPGYPLPGASSEWVDLRVERMGLSTPAEEQDIDRFFASIEATLSEYDIVGDWQLVFPDAPAIEITIDLNGRRIRLASAHVLLERSGNVVVTEHGGESLGQRSRDSVLLQQSEKFQQRRLAFERLLELTLEHVRARLSP
jgi:hypothetical protein